MSRGDQTNAACTFEKLLFSSYAFLSLHSSGPGKKLTEQILHWISKGLLRDDKGDLQLRSLVLLLDPNDGFTPSLPRSECFQARRDAFKTSADTSRDSQLSTHRLQKGVDLLEDLLESDTSDFLLLE